MKHNSQTTAAYDLDAMLAQEIEDLNRDTPEDRKVKEAVIVAKPGPNKLRSERSTHYYDNDESDSSADSRSRRSYCSSDDDYEDDLEKRDPELFKTTEQNRQIRLEGSSEQEEHGTKMTQRPEGLVFSGSPETISEPDRIVSTFFYGRTSEQRKKPHKYFMACDFGEESLYAMRWAISTMLRNGDEIHIASIVATDEDVDDLSDDDQQKLQLNSARLISKIKTVLEKMLLYDIKVVVYAVAGRIQKTLIGLIRDISQLTMVICGSRNRGSLKGMLMGSVSTFLVHNSPIPVSVVRPQKKARKSKKKMTAAQKLSQSVRTGQLKVDEAEGAPISPGINSHDFV